MKRGLVACIVLATSFVWAATPASASEGDIDYSKVLVVYMPGAQWSLNGDGCCDQLTIHDGSPKPTKEQLDAFWRDRVASGAPLTPPPAPPTPAPDSLSLDYSKILSRRFPGMQWSLNGDGCCDQLTIHDGSPKPTRAQLDAMWASVEQEILAEMRAERDRALGTPTSSLPEGGEETAAEVAVSAASNVVVSRTMGARSITTRALRIRDGVVSLNEALFLESTSNRRLVVRATNGKSVFVWFVSRSSADAQVLGSSRKFLGFRFTLRVDGRVVERVTFRR